jgi:hypothetical protein
MSFSLVKRTLFEANSKARRFGLLASHRLRLGGFYPQDPKPSTPRRQILRSRRRLAGMRGTHVRFFLHFASAKKKVSGFFLSRRGASCEKGVEWNFLSAREGISR